LARVFIFAPTNILITKRISSPPSNIRESRQHIDLHIVMMSNMIKANHTTELQHKILHGVHQLKVERDTWQALAIEYKEAFKGQTKRLHELQDICIATQAELENERAERHRLQTLSMSIHNRHPSAIDGAEDAPPAFGKAAIFSRNIIRENGRSSHEPLNPLFQRVQSCVDKTNYGTALAELDRLLRGPLSPKARAEGLLMKSRILKAAGPDELLDALAACSEAQELCGRLSDLESFLPRIQYQRGILYYQLRMLQEARDAFSAVSDDTSLSATANEYRSSCEEEMRIQRASNRRSGFDENRGFEQGLLTKLDEKLDVSDVHSIIDLQHTH
jgi:hypothetical protein